MGPGVVNRGCLRSNGPETYETKIAKTIDCFRGTMVAMFPNVQLMPVELSMVVSITSLETTIESPHVQTWERI